MYANPVRRATLRLVAAATLAASMLSSGGREALAQDYKWPPSFNVITPVVGTANHSLAVAWSSKFQAATGCRVAVLPAPNGFARVGWLNTGEGRVTMLQASDYFDQMDAVQGYASKTAGPSDTRVLNMNMVTPWVYAVQALLAYRNLKESDVDLVAVGSYGANTAVLAEGRVDVTFTSPISGPS